MAILSASSFDRYGTSSAKERLVRGNGRLRRATAPLELVQLTAADEGITWCRGWTGREVDALRTVAALS